MVLVTASGSWACHGARTAIAVLVLVGCASTMTPVQIRTRDDFDACKREVAAPTARLTTVWPDGQFEVQASGPAELRGMLECMRARGHAVEMK